MSDGFSKFKKGIQLDPQSTDPSNPAEGDLFVSDGTPRTAGLWQYKGSAWVEVDFSAVTTEGDLILGNGSGVESRLAIGTNNKILTSNGTTATWEDPAATPPSFTTVTKTTTATLLTTNEDNVVVDATAGDFTVTLPAASGNSGLTYKITKSTAANKVTIDGNASETIGGELTVVLSSKDDSIIITCDGSNWFYISDDVCYGARYTTDAGQTVPTSLGTNFIAEDIDFDTHDGYNTGTGDYTIPIDGVYVVGIKMHCFATDFLSNGAFFQCILQNNSTDIAEMFFTNNSASAGNKTDIQGNGVALLPLSKDDVISANFRESSSDTIVLSSNGFQNVFFIKRIK